MSAGMAYEAMNNAGARNERLIVILNDNDMSIAPPVGAMSAYLARLGSGRAYRGCATSASSSPITCRKPSDRAITRAVEHARGYVTGGTLFEELGFYYVGPIDGHNLDHLLPVLRNVRDAEIRAGPGPCGDAKGQGLRARRKPRPTNITASSSSTSPPARRRSPRPSAPQYTKVFAESLIKEARKDDKIVAITAAMPSGTGLDLFAKEFPDRCFDVGIAEQHAVTFAGGLATEGFKPFATIYSTFLQRAYDQVVHDVAIQRLPVRFAHRPRRPRRRRRADPCRRLRRRLSRLPARLRADGGGATRPSWCTWWRRRSPIDDRPSAFRYPRGEGLGVPMPEEGTPLEIGKGRILREGNKVALFSFGARLGECLKAADELGRVTVCRRRSPMRASPSRSIPICCCGWRASTRC